MIKLNEGEMLADKFWLNPDSKMIWVSDNHIKTLVENPVLFEYDGKEDLERIIKWYLALYGKQAMNYTSVDNFYEKINDSIECKKMALFEHHVYEKGFVWCEYNDRENILTLRSSSMDFLKEAIDDLKDHLHSFKEIHLNNVMDNGSVLRYRLVGKNEIELFLYEMILPRKPKQVNKTQQQKQSSVKITSNNVNFSKKDTFGKKVLKFINKLYAKKK